MTLIEERDPETDEYFEGLGFTQEELYGALRAGYDKLLDFVSLAPFRSLYAEMKRLPVAERPAFVKRVLLRPEELRQRGVVVPDGVLIQRSSFGDRRPTLFCVKTFLPTRFHVVILDRPGFDGGSLGWFSHAAWG